MKSIAFLSALLLAATARVTASGPPASRMRAHHGLVARKSGFEVRPQSRAADPSAVGAALAAIPEPNVIPECSQLCVYVTAPANSSIVWEVEVQNFTISDTLTAFKMGYGQANTFGIQPDAQSLFGVTVGFEEQMSNIISVGTSENPVHTFIARFDTETNAFVGPQALAPYDSFSSLSDFKGNVFLKYV